MGENDTIIKLVNVNSAVVSLLVLDVKTSETKREVEQGVMGLGLEGQMYGTDRPKQFQTFC